MPVGLEDTVPIPVPTLLTLSGYELSWNIAVTEVGPETAMTQAPAPVQAPAQPAKVELASLAAVRVTIVPTANGALQVLPQEIPDGLEVTVPVPLPTFITDTPT